MDAGTRGEFVGESPVAGQENASFDLWPGWRGRQHDLQLVEDSRPHGFDDQATAIVVAFRGEQSAIDGRVEDDVAEHADAGVMEHRGGCSVAKASYALNAAQLRADQRGDKAQGVPIVDIDGSGMNKVVVGEVCAGTQFQYDDAGLRRLGRGRPDPGQKGERGGPLLGLAAARDGEVDRVRAFG